MNVNKAMIGIIALVIFLIPTTVMGMGNPSAVYCEEMGYEWVIEETEHGERGICKFSETEECPAWMFLEGKCGEEHSYCTEKGYKIETTNDPEICPLGGECAVCVINDEKKMEVTEFMKIGEEIEDQKALREQETILMAIVLIIVIIALIMFNKYRNDKKEKQNYFSNTFQLKII